MRKSLLLFSACIRNVTATLSSVKKTTILLLLSFASISFVQAQTATISTDQGDYPPGSTAIITGSGFQPGEDVTLQVLHDPTGGDDATDPSHQPWTVTA